MRPLEVPHEDLTDADAGRLGARGADIDALQLRRFCGPRVRPLKFWLWQPPLLQRQRHLLLPGLPGRRGGRRMGIPVLSRSTLPRRPLRVGVGVSLPLLAPCGLTLRLGALPMPAELAQLLTLTAQELGVSVAEVVRRAVSSL